MRHYEYESLKKRREHEGNILNAYETLTRYINSLENTLHALQGQGASKVSIFCGQNSYNLDHNSSSASGFIARVKEGIADTIKKEINTLKERREELSLGGE